MTKITGDEPFSPQIYPERIEGEVTSFATPGIPIRLHIAAMAMQGYLSSTAHSHGGFDTKERLFAASVERADSLIAAYNNTPNPNAAR